MGLTSCSKQSTTDSPSDGNDSNYYEEIHSLEINTIGNGTVSKIPNKTLYSTGAIVDVIATASTGWSFSKWSGDLDSRANPTTVTMSRDKSITANFTENNYNVITFVDFNFETLIRNTLNKWAGDITDIDLASITELKDPSGGQDIINISGIEYCKNLKTLYISYNKIIDINPLSNLVKLEKLNLSGNQINDISAIKNLIKLSDLGLMANQISNINSITNLNNLIQLHLQYNQISDIYPLVQNNGINNGDHVHLSNNPLNSNSLYIYIPELRSRGVTVYL